jgi:4-carboxymuconolactone decarboxylase
MAPNDHAQQVAASLFGTHTPPIAITDPDLHTLLFNFTFDEILQDSHLDAPTRLMCQLAAILATQSTHDFRIMATGALTAGVTPVQLKELVYHAVPYVGISIVVDFLTVVNQLLQERGVELPLPSQATTTPENRLEKGIEVQKAIIGEEHYEKFNGPDQPADLAPIRRFLSANCFGDYVSRGGIDLRTRELLTLSMLVALGGCDAQVRAHMRANVHVGNDRARMLDVLTQVLPFVGYPRVLNGVMALNEVCPPAKGGS